MDITTLDETGYVVICYVICVVTVYDTDNKLRHNWFSGYDTEKNYDITGFPVMTQTTNYGITGFLECVMRSHTPLALCTRVHIARCVRNAQRKQGMPYITEPIAITLELNWCCNTIAMWSGNETNS